jgi:opacity protein-like surface antigen
MLNRHLIFIVNDLLYQVSALTLQYGRGVSPMKRVKIVVSALAFVAASVFSAYAADDEVIPATQEDAYTPVEIGSGWYIRGDVGINFGGKHNTNTYTLAPVKHDNNFRDAVTFGGGVGYRFNEMFRVDATLDKIFQSNFGSRQLVTPQGPCLGTGIYVNTATGVEFLGPFAIQNCIREDKSDYQALVAMANAYVDLGNYHGFTPFLGAGLGIARVSYTEETGTITCVPVAADVHEETCAATGTIAQPPKNTIYTEPGIIHSGNDWRLAYAVSAGVSYDISKNLKLDTTYRFSNIAGGSGIPYGPTPGSSMSKDGFSLHQIKMGLRYEIW